MSRAAVTLLTNQIIGDNPTPKELLHEPELVVRHSTAPRRAGPASPERLMSTPSTRPITRG
jgi:hypothetical protein